MARVSAAGTAADMAGGEQNRVMRCHNRRGSPVPESSRCRTGAGPAGLVGLSGLAMVLAAGMALADEPAAQQPEPAEPVAQQPESAPYGEPPALTGREVLRPPSELPAVRGPQGEAIRSIETLLDRAPPDYLPLGIHVGSFLIFPTLDIGVDFDDNVFESQNNHRSDVIFGVSPAVIATSTWSQSQLTFFANAQFLEYVAKSELDAQNFAIGSSGRYDLSRTSAVRGSLVFGRYTESSIDSAVSNRPFTTQYYAVAGEANYAYNLTYVGLGLTAGVTRYDFVQNIDRARDRFDVRVTPSVSYNFSPSVAVFAEPSYTSFNFDRLSSLQDYQTISGLFGVRFNLFGTLTGQSSVGFVYQMSDNPVLDNATGVISTNTVTWSPTELTRVLGSFTRSDQPSGDLVNISSVLRSDFTLGVEHDVLRNARLKVQCSYIVDDYAGTRRTDNVYDAQIGGQYLINRNISFFANYEYTERDSNVPLNSFSKNLFLLGVRGAL